MTAAITLPHTLFFITVLLFIVVVPHRVSAPSPPTSKLTSPSIPTSKDYTSQASLPHEPQLRTRLLSRIHRLAAITEDPASPGTTRPYLSLAGARARRALLDMMAESGLQARVDPVGNVIGDLRCPSPSSSSSSSERRRDMLLIASHFDTVPRGGEWDGVYGIVAGMAVAEVLADRVCALPFDVRVVGFDDEEGASGFGVTNAGARAFTGALNLSTDIADYHGFKHRFASVMTDSLLTDADTDAALHRAVAATAASAQHDRYTAALELHIEQGPVLERLGNAVAAVSAIAGQTRLVVRWAGERGHAGTVPMSGRADALAAAARGVLEVERVAVTSAKGKIKENDRKESGVDGETGLVATVGKLEVLHSGTNIIPGSVSMSVDVRAPHDDVRHNAVNTIIASFQHIAAASPGVSVTVDTVHEVDAIPMTPWVTSALAAVADAPRTLTSGAGHDSQFLARVADTGMLFVRCRNGVSHAPDEFVHEDDAYRGALTLLRAVEGIARHTASSSQ